jgi:hypothetical protein
MGLTLIAIFSAALLLPGIIAARGFYFAGQTREVEVPVPSLSTPDGIALVGFFSLLTHALLADPAPLRTESDQIIDRLVLSADEWHNVAFKVFQVIDDEEAPGGL